MKRSAKIASAAAAAVVIGGAVFGVVNASPQQTTNPADTQQVESKCGLSGTPGDPAQMKVTWQDVQGYALPVSSTDGPGVRSDVDSWSCYSRTPAGAVLAGWVIAMRVDGVAPDWQTVVREQTAPGPEQEVKLQKIPSTASGNVQARGFNVAAYTDDRATIAYYVHTDTMEALCTADLVWQNEDWLLKLQPDGDTLSGCSQGVPPSFVPWGPT